MNKNKKGNRDGLPFYFFFFSHGGGGLSEVEPTLFPHTFSAQLAILIIARFFRKLV
jgi:hypothetical protein